MPHDLEIILRMVLASFLGGIIGIEREIHGREAGVRTYLLVALGSALIVIISEYLVVKYHGKFPGEFLRGDPSRIAAQAITGIGFLGAGVIIRYKNSIRGLTTAACMWVVCAIGLAIGSGYYLYGAVVTGIALFALLGLKSLGRKMKRDWYKELTIVSEDLEGQIDRIQEIIDQYNMKVINLNIKRDLQRREITLGFRLRIRAVRPDRNILRDVFNLAGVRMVELE